jgi:hypothetical protein
MQFMPYITKLMTSPAEGITIPRGEFPMCKLHTLYLKWMGALQWMIESAAAPEEHRNAAAVIRTSYVAREDKSGDCLRITPRTGSEQSTHKQASLAIKRVEKLRNDTPRVAWKADFIEWCESGEDGVPFIRKKLALDGDDIDFVRNISDQNGWSCIVNINEIRVLKG